MAITAKKALLDYKFPKEKFSEKNGLKPPKPTLTSSRDVGSENRKDVARICKGCEGDISP
jgi:hypothetical protein